MAFLNCLPSTDENSEGEVAMVLKKFAKLLAFTFAETGYEVL